MTVTDEIKYVGVNDYVIDLFEGMYVVPKGMAYNSYVILDERIAIMDTVDVEFTDEWLENLNRALVGRTPDYLIVQHMEPDHSANIPYILERYPDLTVVASKRAFDMMEQYFHTKIPEKRLVVEDGSELLLGRHRLQFVSAFMVHWPEVIMTYDCTEHILFSADAFGKFGATDAEEEWLEEARRYYFGIVGKYGEAVQKLLKKLSGLKIEKICPLHGRVIKEDIPYYIDKYNTWSAYRPEEEGILIAYTSIYGNTRRTVQILAEELKKKGCKRVLVKDLARCDMAQVVAEAFRFNKLVLATTTYNTGMFPFMREFIEWLLERNYSNRKVALIENGSWMPVAAKQMREKLEKGRNIVFAEHAVRIVSAPDKESLKQLQLLVNELGGNENEVCM